MPPWPKIDKSLQLSPAGAQELLKYSDVASLDYQLAEQLSASVKELIRAHNALVDAGGAEHELAELRLQELQQERRAKVWDRFLWLGLGLIAIGR